MGLRDGSLPVLKAGELGQEFASPSGNRDGCLEPAGENSVLEGQNTYSSCARVHLLMLFPKVNIVRSCQLFAGKIVYFEE